MSSPTINHADSGVSSPAVDAVRISPFMFALPDLNGRRPQFLRAYHAGRLTNQIGFLLELDWMDRHPDLRQAASQSFHALGLAACEAMEEFSARTKKQQAIEGLEREICEASDSEWHAEAYFAAQQNLASPYCEETRDEILQRLVQPLTGFLRRLEESVVEGFVPGQLEVFQLGMKLDQLLRQRPATRYMTFPTGEPPSDQGQLPKLPLTDVPTWAIERAHEYLSLDLHALEIEAAPFSTDIAASAGKLHESIEAYCAVTAFAKWNSFSPRTEDHQIGEPEPSTGNAVVISEPADDWPNPFELTLRGFVLSRKGFSEVADLESPQIKQLLKYLVETPSTQEELREQWVESFCGRGKASKFTVQSALSKVQICIKKLGLEFRKSGDDRRYTVVSRTR